MIVWLNGPFGVGKTTTARAVAQRISRFQLFDPEDVGFMLRNNLGDLPYSDFQEIPAWRRLVPEVAKEVEIATGRSLIAVQSVLDKATWDDLADGFAVRNIDILMVHLAADEQALRDRILGDAEEVAAISWRLDHLRQYEATRPWLTEVADVTIDSTSLAPSEVVDSLEDFLQSPTRGSD